MCGSCQEKWRGPGHFYTALQLSEWESFGSGRLQNGRVLLKVSQHKLLLRGAKHIPQCKSAITLRSLRSSHVALESRAVWQKHGCCLTRYFWNINQGWMACWVNKSLIRTRVSSRHGATYSHSFEFAFSGIDRKIAWTNLFFRIFISKEQIQSECFNVYTSPPLFGFLNNGQVWKLGQTGNAAPLSHPNNWGQNWNLIVWQTREWRFLIGYSSSEWRSGSVQSLQFLSLHVRKNSNAKFLSSGRQSAWLQQ